jgi:tRNA G46 methylase TrmB
LLPGGLLHLATDDPDYAAQFAEVLEGERDLENLFAPDVFRQEFAGRIETAYELEWLAQWRSFHYCMYRRVGSSGGFASSISSDTAEGSN